MNILMTFIHVNEINWYSMLLSLSPCSVEVSNAATTCKPSKDCTSAAVAKTLWQSVEFRVAGCKDDELNQSEEAEQPSCVLQLSASQLNEILTPRKAS